MAVTPDTIPAIGAAPDWPVLAGVTDKNAYLAQVEVADTRQQPYTDEQNAAITAINAVAGQTHQNAEIAETKAGEAEASAGEAEDFKDQAGVFKTAAEAAAIAAGEGAGLPSGGNDGDVLTLVDSVAGTVAFQSGKPLNYSNPNNPSTDTNPTKQNALWLNTASGELFVCVDNTADNNVWSGQLGTVIANFDDGSSIDGLTYADMVTAGNYDYDTDTGYFGEVSSATLMTGDALASDIGLTAGTSQHSSEGWLKFYAGPDADCNYFTRAGLVTRPYVIYIAKKPYRHSVSWDDIYARGAVYGLDNTGVTPTGTPTLQDASVIKSGKTLSVRLMTGVDEDPMDFYLKGCAANVGGRSEWNQLFYRIHTDVPTCPAADDADGGPQIGSNWASFTSSDLAVATGTGRFCYTQDTDSATTGNRAARGAARISGLNTYASSSAGSNFGWRPVLVLTS